MREGAAANAWGTLDIETRLVLDVSDLDLNLTQKQVFSPVCLAAIQRTETRMTTDARVPSHLSATSTKWLSGVLDGAGDEITDTELALLTLAANSLDTEATARRQLSREGITITTRFGETRAHPAASIARDSRATFARIVAQLGLDDAGQPEHPQPRRGGGNRRYPR